MMFSFFENSKQNKRSMSVSRSLLNMEKEKNINDMPQNVICGRNPVIEALKSGANLDTIYIDGNGGSLSVIRRLAKENGIPVQTKTAVAGGNDSGSIHTSADGVRTVAVSAPCRYLHSPSCVLDTRDIKAVSELTKILAKRLASL